MAGDAGGEAEGGGRARHHGAARQGLLQPEHGSDAGATGRLLPAQGAPLRLAERLPERVALLGQGRSGLSGRAPVDGDGHALGRAAAHRPDDAAARGGRRDAGPRRLRGPAPGRRAEPTSKASRNSPSSRPAGRRSTTSTATPCCGPLAVVAYQTLHTLRQHCLSGPWRTAQPRRLRLWFFRLPAKLTTHARKAYLQFLRGEPARRRLLAALRTLDHGIPPPLPA